MTDKPYHGSPADRGSADAYYCRPCRPHRIDGAGKRIENLTRVERDEYEQAFWAEDDRKDWGDDD